jgi:hypothetical protein
MTKGPLVVTVSKTLHRPAFRGIQGEAKHLKNSRDLKSEILRPSLDSIQNDNAARSLKGEGID